MFIRSRGYAYWVVGMGFVGCALPATAEDGLRFNGALSLIGALEHDELVESSINPEKKVLSLPTDSAIFEIRPCLKVKDDTVQIVFRPRLKTSYNTGYKAQTHNDHEVDVRQWVTDGFLQWTASPRLIFAYGRQNYQWGPAEVASPSNRIFHETVDERGILFVPDGKNLMRLNLSVGQHFSTVAMVEYEENKDESVFRADSTFEANVLVKPEINWNNGMDYLGVVLGGRQHWHPWVGEYFSLRMPGLDGLSFYADAAQERGSAAWYPSQTFLSNGPVNAPPTTGMEQTMIDDISTHNFWVGGLRYDFIGGSIFRVEYVRQDAGYSAGEIDLISQSLESQNPMQRQLYQNNLNRLMHPGLEFLGQEYWFSSFHSPNLMTVIDLTLYMRALYSVTDGSVSDYGSLEYKVGDNGTLSGSVLTTSGHRNSELRGTLSPSYVLAYRMDW